MDQATVNENNLLPTKFMEQVSVTLIYFIICKTQIMIKPRKAQIYLRSVPFPCN
jgi:5'-3' exonuclease